VVLIPGLASSSAVWDATATRLEGRYRLHIVQVTILYPWDPLTGMPQAAFDGLYRESFAPLPNKTIVRIDGSFHFIMLDQPDVFAAQVDAFLK
jgi:pimeloyl-ACP methyl ester carboxylesterase